MKNINVLLYLASFLAVSSCNKDVQFNPESEGLDSPTTSEWLTSSPPEMDDYLSALYLGEGIPENIGFVSNEGDTVRLFREGGDVVQNMRYSCRTTDETFELQVPRLFYRTKNKSFFLEMTGNAGVWGENCELLNPTVDFMVGPSLTSKLRISLGYSFADVQDYQVATYGPDDVVVPRHATTYGETRELGGRRFTRVLQFSDPPASDLQLFVSLDRGIVGFVWNDRTYIIEK